MLFSQASAADPNRRRGKAEQRERAAGLSCGESSRKYSGGNGRGCLLLWLLCQAQAEARPNRLVTLVCLLLSPLSDQTAEVLPLSSSSSNVQKRGESVGLWGTFRADTTRTGRAREGFEGEGHSPWRRGGCLLFFAHPNHHHYHRNVFCFFLLSLSQNHMKHRVR